jgi:UDP-N-acetylglucosamine 1-carboxyvinyltransferase
VEVNGAHAVDLEPTMAVLEEMCLDFDLSDQRLVVRPSGLRAVRRITTGLWPAFPSDIVSLVTVLATQAAGRTLVHDWMYELRLFALEQLSAMRGDLFLCDPHRIIIDGACRLRGRPLDSRDIRSGMALVAAALSATGVSTVQEIETVERGYADLVKRLQALGADVERVE